MHNNMTSLVNARHYRSIASLDQPQPAPHRVHLRTARPFRIARREPHSGSRARRMGSHRPLLGRIGPAALALRQSNGRPIVIRDPRIDGPVNDTSAIARTRRGNILNPYFDTTAFLPLREPVHGVAAGSVHQPIARAGPAVAECLGVQVLPDLRAHAGRTSAGGDQCHQSSLVQCAGHEHVEHWQHSA